MTHRRRSIPHTAYVLHQGRGHHGAGHGGSILPFGLDQVPECCAQLPVTQQRGGRGEEN